MSNHACENCNKDDICDYAYTSKDCILQYWLNMVEYITEEEIQEYSKLADELEDKSPYIFEGLIQAYRQIIEAYPSEEDVQYAREILEGEGV